MLSVQSDEHFMRQALNEAQLAFESDEVPVGAVVVAKDRIIARAHNLTEALNDVTAHAELQAITAAADNLGGKYLNGCTLYVTLEPCVMCAGAIFWSRFDRVVIGAKDEKRGFSRLQADILHPRTFVQFGVMEDECQSILQEFFQAKRRQAKLK
jgi:tRNA(adenine34) deaminase